MLKALSLWQPWASLWATEDTKIHETRSWPTKHRGELAIHAAKTSAAECDFPHSTIDKILLRLGIETFDALPRGAIIAVITLEECRPTDRGTLHDLDRLFGNWAPGRFAWRRGLVLGAA